MKLWSHELGGVSARACSTSYTQQPKVNVKVMEFTIECGPAQCLYQNSNASKVIVVVWM